MGGFLSLFPPLLSFVPGLINPNTANIFLSSWGRCDGRVLSNSLISIGSSTKDCTTLTNYVRWGYIKDALTISRFEGEICAFAGLPKGCLRRALVWSDIIIIGVFLVLSCKGMAEFPFGSVTSSYDCCSWNP